MAQFVAVMIVLPDPNPRLVQVELPKTSCRFDPCQPHVHRPVDLDLTRPAAFLRISWQSGYHDEGRYCLIDGLLRDKLRMGCYLPFSSSSSRSSQAMT